MIMPVYNAQAYLQDAVSSVLTQSFKDFELILINDGSTDQSGDLCRQMAAEDARVRYIEQENRGQAAVRNRGLKEATGTYIAFADSDDRCHPDLLKTLYETAEQSVVDIALCGYFMQSDAAASPVFAQEGVMDAQNLCERLPELKEKNLIDPPWNKLYRADFLAQTGVLFPEGEIYEDTDFNLKLLTFSPRVAVASQCLYYYMLRSGSTTRRYDERKWPALKSRMETLRTLLPERSDFCDYCWLRFFFSAHVDMFLSLPKKEIYRRIRQEVQTEAFFSAAKNAVGSGKTAKFTVAVAKSRNAALVFAFCFVTYFLKFKMQKLFLRVRG